METRKMNPTDNNISQLLKPRRKIIAPYPGMDRHGIKVGDIIIDPDKKGECCRFPDGSAAFTFEWERYPHIFQPLPWWAERTLDVMMSVRYIEITEYTGYWRVRDIVPVTDYDIDTKQKIVKRYVLGGSQYSTPQKCKPSNKEEYEAFCKAGKPARDGEKY